MYFVIYMLSKVVSHYDFCVVKNNLNRGVGGLVGVRSIQFCLGFF